MKKCLSHFAILCLSTLIVFTANAQNASSVSGTVKNASTSETVAAVSVTLKVIILEPILMTEVISS